VTKGGKRMRFRVLSVIGNRKGRVGYGLAKGLDVAGASGKATAQARKALITIPLVNETIPHAVEAKFAAAVVLLKPAPKGTGIKAGGAVRNVLELAGVPNVTSKILGSKNKINNVKATFKALRLLKAAAKPAKDDTSRAKPE
jgi:small subunit ribosomal protein S5